MSDIERLSGRERVVRAAYDLFRRRGTAAVGVDTVIDAADVAKMTLYRNFASKEQLVLAFLQRREELWTHGLVRAEAQRRGETPAQRLLAVFDVFTEWFHSKDFDGCAFITTLLEHHGEGDSLARQASVQYLANIREFIIEMAKEAGISDPDHFARQWHILMKGSIIAAHEGDDLAAKRAQELGALLLKEQGVAV